MWYRDVEYDMFRWLLDWLGLREKDGSADTGSETETGEGDDGSDGSGFVPSRLDASVLEAHGMGTSAAERELESIEEKADTLESNHEHPDHEHER